MLAAFGFKFTGVAKIHQGIEVAVRKGEHMAPAPSITTVGATEFFELFMSEGNAPVTAITGGDIDKHFVNKFHKLKTLLAQGLVV
jgi:hypothetical protein